MRSLKESDLGHDPICSALGFTRVQRAAYLQVRTQICRRPLADYSYPMLCISFTTCVLTGLGPACRQGMVWSAGAGKGENPEGIGSSTMGPSRFWVQGSNVPTHNVDTVALLPYYTYLPHRFEHPRRWTVADCDSFKAAILTVVKVCILETNGHIMPLLRCCRFSFPVKSAV